MHDLETKYEALEGVHSEGKSQEKIFFGGSGNCQGVLTSVREFCIFSQMSGKCHGILKRQFYEL